MIIVSSKWCILLHCKSVFLSMTFTTLCRALCLLWCRKLEIPSYAKPFTLDAMSPNNEANIAPLLGLCLSEKWVVLNLFHLSKFCMLYGYSILYAFCRIPHMAQFSNNISNFWHIAVLFSVTSVQITTSGVKVNCCQP